MAEAEKNKEAGFASAGPLLIIINLVLTVLCAYLYWSLISKWLIIPAAIIIFLFSLLGAEASGVGMIILVLLMIIFLFVRSGNKENTPNNTQIKENACYFMSYAERKYFVENT